MRKPRNGKAAAKRRVGRPNTRGETVQVGFRLSKDLDEAIEQLRKMSKAELTKTLAFEKVVRAGLAATLRSSPPGLRSRRKRCRGGR